MAETFAELFEKNDVELQQGAILLANVVRIDDDYVIVDAGLKSEGYVARHEFYNEAGELNIVVGDEVEVALDVLDDSFGETILSCEKAKRQKAWTKLLGFHDNNQTVMGMISGKVKGGFTVDVEGIRAFLPGSLIDVRPVRDPSYLEGKELEFKVIKIDPKRNNVVVSRRAVIEEESSAERSKLLENLQEGQEVKGIVKNLTDYGAFVDLGGVDGLLHITDMSWKRIKHPSEVLNVGDEILVKILKFDKERSRVSLGLKQLGADPWENIAERYPVNSRLRGEVTNIADYGCFVEIEDGVEGLVHVSEMDWTNKNINPNRVVSMGEEIEVLVLEIDEDRRRISLGVKQCFENPWKAFADRHQKDDKIKGTIKSITDFGVFIGLDGGIDGLIHLSDLSWDESSEDAVRHFKKGQEVEALVLAVDPERERISLGIKQLEDDPLSNFLEDNPRGSVLSATVTAVEPALAMVLLAPSVEATLPADEYAQTAPEDMTAVVKQGDTIEVRISAIDRKTRALTVSVTAIDSPEFEQSLQMDDTKKAKRKKPSSSASSQPTKATFGDILKGQLGGGAATSEADKDNDSQ